MDELIEALNNEVSKFIERLIEKGLADFSRSEQATIIMQLDLYNELVKDKNISKLLNAVEKKYLETLNEIVNSAEAMGLRISKLTIDNLKLVYSLDATWLLGSAKDYANLLQSTLMKGIIAGLDRNALLEQVKDIPLLDGQKRVMLNQSFTNYRNLIIEKILGDEKSIRYRYAGPNDEKTRDVCREALQNQRKEGYTMDEIQNGALPGIDWYNLGGFNCRHYWEIVE